MVCKKVIKIFGCNDKKLKFKISCYRYKPYKRLMNLPKLTSPETIIFVLDAGISVIVSENFLICLRLDYKFLQIVAFVYIFLFF